MIEQLSFLGAGKQIHDANAKVPEIKFNNVNWPVPRAGEHVRVRQSDSYMDGIVASVSWYISGSNSGPCVEVNIRETEYCAVCGQPLRGKWFMCDVTMKSYCEKDWPSVRCEELHGEGCATGVLENYA